MAHLLCTSVGITLSELFFFVNYDVIITYYYVVSVTKREEEKKASPFSQDSEEEEEEEVPFHVFNHPIFQKIEK